jgi:hypothetical protein
VDVQCLSLRGIIGLEWEKATAEESLQLLGIELEFEFGVWVSIFTSTIATD